MGWKPLFSELELDFDARELVFLPIAEGTSLIIYDALQALYYRLDLRNGGVISQVSERVALGELGTEFAVEHPASLADQYASFVVGTNGETVFLEQTGDVLKLEKLSTGKVLALQMEAANFIAVGYDGYLAISDNDQIQFIDVDSGEKPRLISSISALDGLPLSEISEIQGVSMGGKEYLLVSSSMGGSITVLDVSDPQKITLSDHLVDDPATRLAGVFEVQHLYIEGSSFVFVVGQEAGVSVFELTPSGFLVLRQTFEAELNWRLDDLLNFTVFESGGEIVMASRSLQNLDVTLARLTAEMVLEQRVVETGATEVATSDQEIFLVADSVESKIYSFSIQNDVLDLSRWQMFYDLDQAIIETFEDHWSISYSTNTVRVYWDESDQAEFANLNVQIQSHYNFRLSHVELSEAKDAPDSLTEGTVMSQLTAPEGSGAIFFSPETSFNSDLIYDWYNLFKGDVKEAQNANSTDTDQTYGGGIASKGTAEVRTHFSNVKVLSEQSDSFHAESDVTNIHGLGGDDYIHATTQDSWLFGEQGDDTLIGGSGDDTLNGGQGRDVLTGGGGANIFVFDPVFQGQNIDKITDFDIDQDVIYFHFAKPDDNLSSLRLTTVDDLLYLDAYGIGIELEGLHDITFDDLSIHYAA